ncbi:MAG TPA: hypothetical protein VF939_11490 [Puia sp.]
MNTENLLDDVLPENAKLVRRRDLLPWWMKVFIWIFIVMGGLSIPVFIIGLLGLHADLAFYGLETNQPISLIGILLMAVFLLKGVVSYGLWAEEDWAIVLGYVDAIAGILICLFVMFGLPYLYPMEGSKFTFRLEILLLVPYLIKLQRLKSQWDKR